MSRKKTINQYEVYANGVLQGYLSNKEYQRIRENEEVFKKDYLNIRQNNISNFINYSLNEKKIIDIDMHDKGVVKTDYLEYTIDNFTKIQKYIKTSTRKLLRYAIFKMNETTFTAKFSLSEYSKVCKKDKGYLSNRLKSNKVTGVIGDLELLKMVTNISCRGEIPKYEQRKVWEFTCIVTNSKYEEGTGKITVNFNSEFGRSLKYFMYLPKKAFSIDDKKYPHAYSLICYWYEKATIDKDNKIRLRIQSNLDRIDLPKKEDIKNWKYEQFLIKPFENTIDYLSTNFEIDARFENENGYKTIDEFLNGYILVEIGNQHLISIYKKKKLAMEKKRIQTNVDNKKDRKNKALRLKDEGKTIKEIADILELTERTIKTYINEKS